ncbi:MAG: exonuclease domain-containing protein [Bacteroidia bacterium]
MNSTYCVVDIEATGGNHKNGRIIEIGIVKIRNQTVVSEYSTLVNPQQKIDKYVSKLTGITDAHIINAPLFADVANEIIEFLGDSYFVAHNATFDYTYLRAELKKLGIEYTADQYCTIDISRMVFPNEESYSLGKLCRSLNLGVEDRHRALGDAQTTATLFIKLLQSADAKSVLQSTIRKGQGVLDDPKGKVEMSNELLNNLPDEPGIFYLKDKRKNKLYIGRGESVKNEAKKLFSDSKKYERFKLHQYKFNSIEYELTGNELLAELLFYDAVKEKPPVLNMHIKQLDYRYAIAVFKKGKGLKLAILRVNDQKTVPIAFFKDFKSAEKELKKIAEKFKLSSGSYDLKLQRLDKRNSVTNQKEIRELAKSTVFQKIIYHKRNYQPNGVFVGAGLKVNEKVLFYIDKGKLIGYLVVAKNKTIETKEELKDKIKKIVYKDGAKICWHYFMLTKQYQKVL